jgi:hypothetical protein
MQLNHSLSSFLVKDLKVSFSSVEIRASMQARSMATYRHIETKTPVFVKHLPVSLQRKIIKTQLL